jgi:nucleotide-binding universal stress UspA family protein
LPAPALACASRAADLIIAGGAPRQAQDPYKIASPVELAMTSGRPVLVAPPEAPGLSAKQVVLAWKDTREARRALSDALPFLHRADLVEVVEVSAAAELEQADIRTRDVAAALQRRGIKAEAKVVEHARVEAHQVLREASHIGADLIVAGAYGHTRLGEWVFGGFTRDLLLQDDCYLVLSH